MTIDTNKQKEAFKAYLAVLASGNIQNYRNHLDAITSQKGFDADRKKAILEKFDAKTDIEKQEQFKAEFDSFPKTAGKVSGKFFSDDEAETVEHKTSKTGQEYDTTTLSWETPDDKYEWALLFGIDAAGIPICIGAQERMHTVKSGKVTDAMGATMDKLASGGYATDTTEYKEIPETDPVAAKIKEQMLADFTVLVPLMEAKKKQLETLAPNEQQKIGEQVMEAFPEYMKQTGLDVRMMRSTGAATALDDAKEKMKDVGDNVKGVEDLGNAIGKGLEASMGAMGGGMLAMMLPMMFMAFISKLLENPKEVMDKTVAYHFYEIGTDMIAVDFWDNGTNGQAPTAFGSVLYKKEADGSVSFVNPLAKLM